MQRGGGRRLRFFVAVLIVAVFAWALRLATTWGDRTAVALAVFAFIAGVVLAIDWLVVSYGPGLWRFTRSLAASIWAAVRNDGEVKALVARHPEMFGWLGRRFTRQHASGLYLTVTVLATLFFLSNFVSLAFSLLTSRAITLYDPQVMALLRAFRTPGLTRVLWAATLLADPRAIPFLALAACLLLLLWGRRSEAAFVALVLIAGIAVQTLAKMAFARPRPPAALALIKEPASSSFPSTHAFVSLLFAGLLVFVLWRVARLVRVRLALLFVAGVIVVAVGLSRVYLGVHWMSDVVASWALAMTLLVPACGVFLMLVRYRALQVQWPPWSTARFRNAITLLVVLATITSLFAGAEADPLLARITARVATRPWAISVSPTGTINPTAGDLRVLPLYSEKLDGSRQEPISIVFVGSRAQLVSAFKAAGWLVADKPSLVSLSRASFAALGNRPYPTAPVTPTFLGGAVQDIAFEKASGTATVRRRHHARFWRTRETIGGVPVWVATASFDSRLEIGSAIPLPTHHIEPNLDAEQAYLVHDLTSTGQVKLVARLRVAKPLTGTNAQGDFWFTQGLASVLQATR